MSFQLSSTKPFFSNAFRDAGGKSYAKKPYGKAVPTYGKPLPSYAKTMPPYATKPIRKIVGTVTKESGGPYYGTLIVKDIKYDDGSPVAIEEFLGIKFKAPKVTAAITVNVSLQPYQTASSYISTEPNEDETLSVTAKIALEKPHTTTNQDVLTFYINGDLDSPPGDYTEYFGFFADYLPSG